jgi:FtsP/CotA-like multicopper oxidase with cupredoxin domain
MIKIFCIVFSLLSIGLLSTGQALGQDTAGMGQEQAKEREELQNMRNEIKDIKGTMNGAINDLNELNNQMQHPDVHEYHLFAKTAACEVYPGLSIDCLTYNGRLPGPPLRVRDGELVRIVLHNQLKVPTSLLFQGIIVPQTVGGLPRKDAGVVQPGGVFAYQFMAKQPGIFCYHPQIVNQDQRAQGMYGCLIVDPKGGPTTDKEVVWLISELKYAAAGNHQALSPTDSAGDAKTVYLVNGKAAPAVPPIELRQGERVRLRVVNAAPHAVPLHLSGHRFEVISTTGSDVLEPHVFRDTVTINPSDRVDLEFTADNPGVWSLASELMEQATTNGRFPGGIACVVRYSGL